MRSGNLISIVTPCYNEGDRIITCCDTVEAIFKEFLPDYRYEHIICDNDSTDDNYAVIRKLAKDRKHIKVIRNTRNFGVLPNAYNGVIASQGDAVLMLLPVDLQDPPELIPTFVEKWSEGYDIVYGARNKRKEGIVLRSIRYTFYNLLTMMSEFNYPRNAGDFQLVDRRIIDEIKTIEEPRPFLRMMTFSVGGPSFGVGYTWRRAERPSKNGIKAMIGQGLVGITAFSAFPLRAALILGLCFAIFSIIYAIISLLTIVLDIRTVDNGIASLIFGVFFVGGINLIFLGIVGEYLLNIFKAKNSRKVVYERERINFD